MDRLLRKLETIRYKYLLRMDADEDDDQNSVSSGRNKKGTALSTSLPYGIARDLGINTEGMKPREVWDAIQGKGIDPKEALKAKLSNPGGKVDISNMSNNTVPGPTKTISSCKDQKELFSYMRDKHGINVDDAVAKEISDVKTLKHIMTGFEKAFEETPVLKTAVEHIVPYNSKNGVMGYNFANGEHKMCVNLKLLNDPQAIQDMIDEQVSSGFWPKGTTLESLVDHELGHAVEKMITENCGLYDDDKAALGGYYKYGDNKRETVCFAMSQARESRKIVSDTIKAFKKTKEGKGLKADEIRRSVSRYGATNDSELLAECFADCCANGENANTFSKMLKKAALDKLEEVMKK